jgi:hypothetical protein
MAITLKEQHRVKSLKKKLLEIDRKVVSEVKENTRELMILEAFDKQQMAAAVDIIKKLKTLNFGSLTTFAQARDAAVADVTKVLSGDKSQGIVKKIVNLFKDKKDNPLVDVLAFSDALQNFFEQFSQYVTALGGDDDSQTLGTAVTGKSADELADLSAVKGLGGEEKKKLAQLQKIIVNGLKPQGALANIGKNWVDKYLKGSGGLRSVAKELINMSVKDLNAIAKNVAASLKNTDAVGQAAAGAAEQASVETTGTTGTEKSGSTQSTTGSSGTKSGATAPGAQVAKQGRFSDKEQFKDFVASYQKKLKDVPEEQVAKVIDALRAGGQLK